MDVDGPAILDQISTSETGGGRLPVLALTRRGDLRTTLAALEVGADDILDVPFAVDELAARVIALFRRSYGDAVTPFTPTVINVGELEFDMLNRSVRVGAFNRTWLHWSRICCTCWRPTLVVSLVARRSWTRCGVQTTLPIAR